MEFAEFSRETLFEYRTIEHDDADTVFPLNDNGLIFHIIPHQIGYPSGLDCSCDLQLVNGDDYLRSYP